MLKNIKAVIFDMDGSLIDSMWIWKDIDIEYLSRYGYHMNSETVREFQANIQGMSFYETAVWVKEHYKIPKTIEEMMDDWNKMAWDKYENQVFLKPGALEFLEECKRRDIKLGIATSNSRELVENVMQARKIQKYFQVIVTGSEIIHGKPAPDIYLTVAKALEADCCDCLVFEDIPAGITAAKRAGMKVCAVKDEYSMHLQDEKISMADYYIEDYYGLFK